MSKSFPLIQVDDVQISPYCGPAWLARLDTPGGGSLLVKNKAQVVSLAKLLDAAIPHCTLEPKGRTFDTEIEVMVTVLVRGEVLDADDGDCKPEWELNHTPGQIHKLISDQLLLKHIEDIEQAEETERYGGNEEPEDQGHIIDHSSGRVEVHYDEDNPTNAQDGEPRTSDE